MEDPPYSLFEYNKREVIELGMKIGNGWIKREIIFEMKREHRDMEMFGRSEYE